MLLTGRPRSKIFQEIAGAIHGYDHLHPTGVKYLYVDEVDTIEGHRRQGVATVMMNEVFAIAHENGDSEIWLGTEDDNEKAKAFYLSLKPDEIENGPIYTWKVKHNGKA
jgi:ribosomal protein S18 acetylase RimI-like enzyme